jgi:phosphoribosyl 1,2-cyclic phosphodiesterase
MSLQVSSINSGSNGNCYYVGNDSEAVLIDIGISCREVEKRLKRLSLDVGKIKAIFISHEHSDHIRGLEVFSRKHKLPVYITRETLKGGRLFIEETLLRSFNAHDPVVIGSLVVTAFPKFHDAADPHSFIVEHQGVVAGIFTDIGESCDHVVSYFKKCHMAFLESNYDEHMLETGAYPYYLKKRIRSDKGHLSNAQALKLFVDHRPEFMSHVFLSHLSKDNNCPILAGDLFKQHSGNTKVVVASRYEETPVYEIGNGSDAPLRSNTVAEQMSLFSVPV